MNAMENSILLIINKQVVRFVMCLLLFNTVKLLHNGQKWEKIIFRFVELSIV